MNKTLIYIVIALLVGGGLVYGGFLLNKSDLGAFSSPYYVGPETSIGDLGTFVVSGSFKDATTTIFSVKNPYTATATVDFVVLNNPSSTPATTTYGLLCGVTAIQSATTTCASGSSAGDCYKYDNAFRVTPSYQVLPTPAFVVGGNDKAGTYSISTSTSFGFVAFDPATTSSRFGSFERQKMYVSPEQYFGCVVDVKTTGSTVTADKDWSAFTSSLNSFDGTFKVKFVK